MGTNSLIYSFVAKGSVVLAEQTAYSGNFSTIAVQCLEKLPSYNSRQTYACDGHSFNYLVEDGFVFLVVANDSVGRELPFAFLERIKEDFKRQYLEGDQTSHDFDTEFGLEDKFDIAYSLDKEFGPKLKEHMQYCSEHPEDLSRIARVKSTLSDVRGIVIENIEKLLDRGEKIELLVDKTENLRFQADSFQRQGRQLRRKMWLQSVKIKLAMFGITFIFILIIWLSVCHGLKCK
ncbi:hypothetical protein GOP47_0017433 [Adiantum capillus-veneris]|uniref:Uncharacterized protein n=1 Tax=Adiantum capillus-veneris TaxID=13818 RepID=A0A9D4UFF3_ADICA|nr:hypothetical protein GOP47_0017433 [Adiantum capillus-veneris]